MVKSELDKIISRREYQKNWAKNKKMRKKSDIETIWVKETYEYICSLDKFNKEELNIVYIFLKGVERLS